MPLPQAFIEQLSPYMSDTELAQFLQSLANASPTTALRHNPAKPPLAEGALLPYDAMEPHPVAVPWNANHGRLLPQRPVFTLDPLLHAGCYYIQEAASQFVGHVLRSLLNPDYPVTMLDLCAAPGGKSTAALDALPAGSLLVSNEIDRRRARILAENLTKWGRPNVCVTANAPADLGRLTATFDVILTDVPCSGEGMFRKDDDAVTDWSPSKVDGCVTLQRQILADIWPALKPGGLLIYSTCTFNVREDEEQVAYIARTLGADVLQIPIDAQWKIHPPLTGELPCYRFMPHYTQGEGLFMAALRKHADQDSNFGTLGHDSARMEKKHDRHIKGAARQSREPDLKTLTSTLKEWVKDEGSFEFALEGDEIRFIPAALHVMHQRLTAQGLYLLQSGITVASVRGRDLIPAHHLALSTALAPEAFPHVELDKDNALTYLRREAITLPPEAARGYVLVCYEGHPLGFVKNMGNRSNNLYPQEWRIRYV